MDCRGGGRRVPLRQAGGEIIMVAACEMRVYLRYYFVHSLVSSGQKIIYLLNYPIYFTLGVVHTFRHTKKKRWQREKRQMRCLVFLGHKNYLKHKKWENQICCGKNRKTRQISRQTDSRFGFPPGHSNKAEKKVPGERRKREVSVNFYLFLGI